MRSLIEDNCKRTLQCLLLCKSNEISSLRGRVHQGTLLHAAVGYNKLTMTKMLLRTGIDVNVKNHSGKTALRNASLYGFNSIITHLLSHNANPLIKSDDEFNSLDVAKCKKHHESVEILNK